MILTENVLGVLLEHEHNYSQNMNCDMRLNQVIYAKTMLSLKNIDEFCYSPIQTPHKRKYTHVKWWPCHLPYSYSPYIVFYVYATSYVCTDVQRSLSQGSHRNSKTQFHDFSMIFHDQPCNFHDYLMHGLQPPLLAASSPR